MTTPQDDRDHDDRGVGEAGALAAASEDHPEGSDPLGPLDRVTEDDSER